MLSHLTSLSLLLATTWASIPTLDGYHVVFSDDFNGDQGTKPSSSRWNTVVRANNPNDEVEQYTNDALNAHLSGDGQLYILPVKKGNTWTSARLESAGAWTCGAGSAMIFQAEIKVPDFTGSPAKFAGLWPAFWTKGNSFRTSGVGWPACGEWDIFEVTDRMSNRNQGTLHFKDAGGNNNGAFSGQVTYQGGAYHTWALKVDRRSSDWKQQKLTWYLDGTQFYQVTGSMIGTENEWHVLAWDPYYIILNMALGGGYAGDPTGDTVSGYDSSMRVRYVAVYQTN